MELTKTVVFLFAGCLLLGLFIGWLLSTFFAKQKMQYANEKEVQLQQQLTDEKQLNTQLEEERNQLRIQRTALQKDVEFIQNKLSTQIENEERLQQQFERLANRVIDEKSERINTQNKEQLQYILNPLKERLQHFEQKVEQNNAQQLQQHTSLKEQLLQLKELNTAISEEANNLTKALKGETKTQVKWGELILETVLEKSGLEKNREYFVQEQFSTADGKRKQPDVILHLPENKRMIIDAKVSLTAYEQFVNATTETERKQFLQQHSQSLRRHIQQLSQKQYEQIYATNSPDFVLLFVPIETAFSVLVQQDASLYQSAFDKNIVIVTPSTLLATLKTIDSLWQTEKQRKNTIEIATEAGKMYDKFILFLNDLEEIAMRIRQTDQAYESAISRLKTGRGNLLSKAEKLKRLGAKASKEMNEQWIDSSQEEE